ncbi:MAG: hypothetical protein KKB31_07770 [Nanoarchaeota archaeon]|nr:hypothetical protein [Nanoarchaeota archaeon]
MTETKEQVSAGTPATPTDDQLRLREIDRARSKALNAHMEMETARDRTSLAKKKYESAINEFLQAGAPLPLFNQPQGAGEVDDWQMADIAVLDGLSNETLKCLRDAGLNTLGDMAKFREHTLLTDIKGIGESKADDIEAALELHWEMRAMGDAPDEGPDDEGGE